MLKRAEKMECCSDMRKKDIIREAAFEAGMVIERVALDANLLLYEIVVEFRELMIKDAKKTEEYAMKMHSKANSILNSLRRYPRVSAMLYGMVVLR